MYKKKFSDLDKKLFTKKDRFKLSFKDEKELKKNFFNGNILIIGAAGSIGSTVVKNFKKYKFKSMFLLDKNENGLTELNRSVRLIFKKNIKKFHFICADLNLIDINKFINENRISHFLNFSALKHVRSEENIYSIKYMFLTNSKNFLPKSNFKIKLKQLFSVSTDKSVSPASFLGVSKYLMEQKLAYFKLRNKKIHVSTSRFANVSFSNGSILKSIVDNLSDNKTFGIPKNINRYFITHEEASSLCFKSLLKRNNGKIIIPNDNLNMKEYSIKELCIRISKILKFNITFTKNKFKNQKKIFVKINSSNVYGQKKQEQFYHRNEINEDDKYDKSIKKINLELLTDPDVIIKKIIKLGNYIKIKNYFKKKINNFTTIKKPIKLSKVL